MNRPLLTTGGIHGIDQGDSEPNAAAAAAAAAAGPPPTFCTTGRSSSAFIFVCMLFYCINWVESDLMGAFIRSTIRCANTTNNATVYPPHTPEWSGSVHCHNKHIVLQESTHIQGTVTVINRLLSILASVVLGPCSDTKGRKRFMVLSFFGYFLCCALLYTHALATTGAAGTEKTPNTNGGELILFLAIGCSSAFSTFPVASQSMAADVTKDSEARRGYIFTWLAMGKGLGTLVGFSGGFFVLKMCLTNYENVWFIFTVVCLIAMFLAQFLLVETLETTKKNVVVEQLADFVEDETAGMNIDETESDEIPSTGCAALLRGCSLIVHDRFLFVFIFSTFIGVVGIYGTVLVVSSFLLGRGKGWVYSQATASLAGVFLPVAAIGGYLFAGLTMDHLGSKGVNMLGKFVICLGLSVLGFFAHKSPAWYWVGWEIFGLGFGMVTPTEGAVVSVRVHNRDQGKVLTILLVVLSLGVAAGAYIWSSKLYDSGCVGSACGVPFLWSAGVVFVSNMIFAAGWWVYER
jgi:MFS family permease